MRLPPPLEPFFEDPSTIGSAVLFGLGALLVIRVVRLGLLSAAHAGSPQDITAASPLRSLSLPRLWRTRKEKLAEQAELVRSETDLLLARLDNARAVGGLTLQRAELEKILSSVAAERATPPQTERARALTLREIEQLLAALPQSEISSEQRRSLTELFAARLHEKRGGDA